MLKYSIDRAENFRHATYGHLEASLKSKRSREKEVKGKEEKKIRVKGYISIGDYK